MWLKQQPCHVRIASTHVDIGGVIVFLALGAIAFPKWRLLWFLPRGSSWYRRIYRTGPYAGQKIASSGK